MDGLSQPEQAGFPVEPFTSEGPRANSSGWFHVARLVGGFLILVCLGYFLVEIPGKYWDVYWSMETMRLNVDIGLSRRFWTILLLIEQYITMLVAGLTALLIYLKRVLPRRSFDWTALVASATLMIFILVPLGPPEVVYYPPSVIDQLLTFSYTILIYLLLVLLVNLMFIFPNGHFVPAWTRWVALAATINWVVFGLLYLLPEDNNYIWYIGVFPALVFVVCTLVAFAVQVYRFRRVSDPIQRQQTKWVVFSLALIPVYLLYVIVSNLSGVMPRGIDTILVSTLQFLIALLIPLSIGVSILRYRLWDIDVIIRRTLVYGGLTLTLAMVYFSIVILLQSLFEALSGQRSAVAVVISTLVIAALFTPLRRRIQNDIDRRFFRKKYDAEKIVAAFGASLREEVDLDDLQSQVVGVVQETLQPEMVCLWIRDI
jgi:hypothetical protein